jgi:succinate dehydrogenase/fumarate reductase cytochrome b subunit
MVGAGMFRGEKTSLFWAGLIILCFACVYLFGVLWSGYQRLPYLPITVFLESLPSIVGAIVFIVIGLFMMHSVVREKTFWAGLIILSLSSLVLFQEAWNAWRSSMYYSSWWMFGFPVVVGTIVFIFLGYAMMRSGLGKHRPLMQS